MSRVWRAEGVEMDGQRVLRVGVLALDAGEQLDRLDVGIGVDDAAGEVGARMGERLRAAAYLRHHQGEHDKVIGDPDHERHGQPNVGAREDDERGQSESRHEPQRIDDLHHAFAQGGRALHDVGGDAAGEIIGEIAHRLAQGPAVRLPADEVGEARRDRLLGQEIVREARQRPDDQHQRRHAEKLEAMAGEDFGPRRRAQHVDQRSGEAEDRGLDERNDEAEHDQRRDQRPDLPAIAQVIGDDGRRRHALVMRAKWVDEAFERSEHGRPWAAPRAKRTPADQSLRERD